MSRTLAFAAAAALAVPALAQDRTDRTDRTQDLQDRQLQSAPDRQADRTANRPVAQPGDASAVPADALARWASQDNQAEIALAEFAKQKTQTPAVRQFAEKMIEAHTKYGKKLDAVAANGAPGRSGAANRRTSGFRGGDLPADPAIDPAPAVDPAVVDPAGDPLNPYEADLDAPAADDFGAGAAEDFADADPPAAGAAARQTRPNRNRMNRGGTTAGATAADVLAFRETLKKQCGETLKENFDKLTPNDFDKAYASQQIGAHLSMIDTLTLAQKQADGEAAEVFAAGITETKQHLMMAIQLLNQVTPANVD